MIHINDVFWTFQGEGKNAGRRALFVRMPFCNIACPWCDTEFNSFREWSKEELTKVAISEPSRFAVITGGEPTFHKHTPDVISLLRFELGFEIAIESNGHFPIPAFVDFVTISPKAYTDKKSNHPFYVCEDAWKKASEFKYVVESGFDFDLLKRHDTSDGRRYSLSPEFGDMKKSVDAITEFIKENPGWQLSLQTHKWLGIP